MVASIQHRPDIDGLRAVAVVAVVGYHAAPALVPGGFVGVDVFFVISGYLITSIILAERDADSFSIWRFYARRVRRLFPALILVLTATLLLGWYYLIPHEFRSLGWHLVSGAAYFINFTLRGESGYFDTEVDQKPLLHLWSLAVEEQFYLVWPAFLMVVGRRYLLVALIAVTLISLASCIEATLRNSAAGFYHPHNRMWQLAAGALLAYIGHHASGSQAAGQGFTSAIRPWANWLSVAGLLLVLVAMVQLDNQLAYPGAWALLPTFGTVLLIEARTAWLNRCILSQPLLVGIGLVSYPLYLWHWPLLSYLHIVGDADQWSLTLAAVGLALLLAVLTYVGIERSIRRAEPLAMAVPLLGLSILLCASGLAAHFGTVQPRLHDARLQEVGRAIDDWQYPNGLIRTKSPDGLKLDQAPGNARSVLYLGDSHMQQYWPRIEHLISKMPAPPTILFATGGGCPPIPSVRRSGYKHCVNLPELAIKRALESDVDTVVIAADWRAYFLNAKYHMADDSNNKIRFGYPAADRAFDSLGAAIGTLTKNGKKVWLVLGIPTGTTLAPQNSLSRHLGGDVAWIPRTLDRAGFEKFWAKIRVRLKEVAIANGASVIDPTDYLCNEVYCRGEAPDGSLLYKDLGHLRASYVRDHVTFIDVTLGAH